jgi:glycosyltransferase involved in cell wall biosynthesis
MRAPRIVTKPRRSYPLHNWYFITPEYSSLSGGVGQYAEQVARGLVASGDRVEVWTPRIPDEKFVCQNGGPRVNQIGDGWNRRGRCAFLEQIQSRGPGPIVVQYVGLAFGWGNFGFGFLLHKIRKQRPVWVMFHEVALWVSTQETMKRNVWAAVDMASALIVAKAADQAFVSTIAWGELVKRLAPSCPRTWSPVPSNVSMLPDYRAIKSVRANFCPNGEFLIGMFGGGSALAKVDRFASVQVVMRLLHESSKHRTVLLIGRAGLPLLNDLMAAGISRGRIYATGDLTAEELSSHLSACDLMVQPYTDGVSGRRTSAMAALEHGIPLLTTEGSSSEQVWRQSGAVALAPVGDFNAIAAMAWDLQHSQAKRERLGSLGKAFYRQHFTLANTIRKLRDTLTCATAYE